MTRNYIRIVPDLPNILNTKALDEIRHVYVNCTEGMECVMFSRSTTYHRKKEINVSKKRALR